MSCQDLIANWNPWHGCRVLTLREQCIHAGVPFRFHQTGAKLIKDGRQYYIRRCYQHAQAKKAGVDFGVDGRM